MVIPGFAELEVCEEYLNSKRIDMLGGKPWCNIDRLAQKYLTSASDLLFREGS
jgi:hypothetical protein